MRLCRVYKYFQEWQWVQTHPGKLSLWTPDIQVSGVRHTPHCRKTGGRNCFYFYFIMFTHSVISIEPLLFARQKSFCFSKKYYKHFLIYWEESLANVYEFADYFYTQREGGVEIKSMRMDWRTPLPLHTLTYTHTSILFYYSFLWEKTGRIRSLTTACRCQRSRDMKVVSVRKQPWSHLPWGERERRGTPGRWQEAPHLPFLCPQNVSHVVWHADPESVWALQGWLGWESWWHWESLVPS